MTEFVRPDIDWAALSPILALLGGSAVVLLVGLVLPGGWKRPFALTVSAACFIGAAGAAIALFAIDDSGTSGVVADALHRDRLAEFGQILVALVGFLAVLASYRERERTERVAEYYALLLAAVAGMSFFIASNNLITLFVGLEWFSICLYILVAIGVERMTSLEASLKYLIVGSFGSAILLFGSALVYGGTESIYFLSDSFDTIAAGASDGIRLFVVTGLAMLLVGFAFKISAAPFHMWTPDVYEGAPTPVTGFMAAATKISTAIVLLYVLVTAFSQDEQFWTITLAVIIVISLAWGNLAAIAQTNVKRLLAYSSISHAGFILMPIAAGNALGGSALLVYLIPYGAMTIGAFAIVSARERELGHQVTFQDLNGFGWERPVLAGTMALYMFGFIGLPPAGLFWGKFYVFAAVIERGWEWLAILGVIFTVVSIYYYLGLIRVMYMSKRLSLAPAGGSPPRDSFLTATVLTTAVITLGSFFAIEPLLELADDAVAFLEFL